MMHLTLPPLSDLEIGAIVISILFTFTFAWFGLYKIFGPDPPDNYRSPQVRPNRKRAG